MSNPMNFDNFYFSSETLSLINKYVGSTVVIKYGGSVMKDSSMQLNIIRDISILSSLGIKVVLVHGGGYLINQWLAKLDIKPKFKDGLRITDMETMNVVEMVLSGQINKNLVSLLNKNYVPSVGLSGKDANLVTAIPMFDSPNNFTGKVDSINPLVIHTLLSNNLLPVIASIATDSSGNTYNINADMLASSIASVLKAKKLMFLTDMPGVMQDMNDKSTLMKSLNLEEIEKLKSNNVIKNGMIPKINCCIEALKNGVQSVHIFDGRVSHAILDEVLTNKTVGSTLMV
uniref:Acetylglutamate kinase n=1 Tax=Polysiphonia scopulorum TaxID=257860 RepID=A0A1Z1MHW0_9FLOR|nr:acetylglutamate kinase [Polysiphonia scopulorum]ARW65667.1 acetylglutamate kinase [Polysiphonia scopulorum]